MKRRSFLKTAAALTAWGRLRGGARPRSRTNVLVIMSDEHNAHVAGCYGNALARTPHLDSLAERGVVFERAYTNSPLCVPSRLSFTSGKYASRVGAWSNTCWLPSEDYPSLPRVMNAAGYESFLCGKMHYDRTRRYGFTEIGGEMNRSHKTGLQRSGGGGPRRLADDTTAGTDARFRNFRPGDSSQVLAHDRQVTAGVCDFLSRRRRGERPFFMIAGYLAPHFPLIVPQAFWDRFRGRIPMPVLPEGHVASQPRNYHHLRRGFGIVETDPALVRKGRELYYGLTEWLDREIGKVLRALAASDAAGNTMVVYTTDHGENMGEHALWWKNCMYEHAARVPLIVSRPDRWAGGQRRSGACSLLDLGRTIAETGGAEAPGDWNGDSLCSWLDDPRAAWKDTAVSEYYAHNICSGFAMVRRGRYKYVYHTAPDEAHGAERELYDLEADPGEFRNLAGAPEHAARIQTLHAALLEELGEDPEATERRCRADLARGYGRTPKPGRGGRK